MTEILAKTKSHLEGLGARVFVCEFSEKRPELVFIGYEDKRGVSFTLLDPETQTIERLAANLKVGA